MKIKFFGPPGSDLGWTFFVFPMRLFKKSFFCLQAKLRARPGLAKDFMVLAK
jgi:hypothetical protein